MFAKFFFILAILFFGTTYTVFSKRNLEQYLENPELSSDLKVFPNVKFKSLDTSEYSKNDLFNGNKWLIVHYWATWCGPCDKELPELISFFQSLKTQGKLVLVAVNDESEKVKKVINKLTPKNINNIHWVIDNENIHLDYFGTSKLPETFVFLDNSSLFKKFVGPQDWLKPHFSQIFQELTTSE